MNLQESIDSLPSRITAAIKDLFPSADARVKDLEAKFLDLEGAYKLACEARDRLTGVVAGHEQKNAEQAKTIETLTARVTELEAAAKTTAQTARELVAAQGVPVATLPANNGEAAAKDTEAQLAALREQAANEKDPAKRGELYRQCRILRDGGQDWLAPKK